MNIDELNPQSNTVTDNNPSQGVPTLNYETPSVVSTESAPAVQPVAPVMEAAPVVPAIQPVAEPAVVTEAPVVQEAAPQIVQPVQSAPVNSMPELSFETPLESIDSAVQNQNASIANSEAQTQMDIASLAPAATAEVQPAPAAEPVVESAPVAAEAPVTFEQPTDVETPVAVAPAPMPSQFSTPQINVAPAPAQTVTPAAEELVVVSNEKRKTASNVILVLLTISLVVFVFYIEEAVDFIETNILPKTPFANNVNNNGNGTSTDNGSLIDGYIKIDDATASYNYEKIRFYNFSKSGGGNILVNYESTKNYNNVDKLGLYIEIYDSERSVLYKSLFAPTNNKVENSSVGSVLLKVNDIIYKNAYFAKIVTYSESDLSSTQTITCTYDYSNTDYLLAEKVVYNFKNNNLVSYDVSKRLEVLENNKNSKNAKSVLSKENSNMQKYEITTVYSEADSKNVNFSYSITLDNANEGLNLLYDKTATPKSVELGEKSKEKKWVCE